MFDKNFEVISSNLYKIYCDTYTLNDFIFQEYTHPELDLYFEILSPYYLVNTRNNEDALTFKRVINTCLYVYYNLFFDEFKQVNPLIKTSHEFYKVKIFKQKQTWYDYVNKFKPKKFANKYIDKEIQANQVSNSVSFRKKRLDDVMRWVLDDNQLLSDFIYMDDLVYKQKKVILQTDPLYLLLKEISSNSHNHPILLFLDNISSNSEDLIMLPETFLNNPNEFIYGNYRLEDLEYSETNGNYTYKVSPKSEVTEMLPALGFIEDEISGLALDLSSDKITSNSFDFQILSYILRLSFENLLSGVTRTSFSLRQICEAAKLPISTNSYNRIKKSIMLAKTKILASNYNSTTMVYTHIDKIFIPTNNEDKEQIWTIEWGSHILKEIELKKYKTIFYEQFLLRSNLAILISRMIVKDVNKSKIIRYTWEDIYNATLITGKPSEKKKKIVEALDEIVSKENPLIIDYQTDEGNNWFVLTLNDSVIHKNIQKNRLT